MRKKCLASAALALLCILLAGSACAVYCYVCGVSISDSAHICPRCGARQMPSSSALTISGVRPGSGGTAIVSWNGGTGPYTIWCVQKLTNDVHTDLTGSGCMGLRAASPHTFDGYSGSAEWLVPGQDYWIFVYDAKGRPDYEAYIPGRAPDFSDFPIRITLQPIIRHSHADTECTTFSASDFSADAGSAFGAQVCFAYEPLPCEGMYTAAVCITAPDGAVLMDQAAEMLFPAGSISTCFPFYDLTPYFRLVHEHYGAVPTGDYTLSVYLDGMYAGSQTFCVTN